jgi:NAD(P)H dehydrogenase (quinone)
MEWHTEHATTASGMTHTIPRDSFYADLLPTFADKTGLIAAPVGQGRGGAVARYT